MMSHRRTFVALAMAIAVAASPPLDAASRKASTPQGAGYAQRDDVREFIDDLAREHGFSRATLRNWFSDVRYQPKIVAAMQRPLVEPPKWYEYAPQFLSPARIDEGVAFYRAHEAALRRAETAFGVPAEIIVAIIGVETFYGRNTGNWRVVDALTTLAFDYPPRASFFRNELEQYLLLSRDTGADVFSVRGSYAGAIGIPQFMPSSTRRFAVDFDGSGAVALRGSPADAIGSVAMFWAMQRLAAF